MENNIIHHVKIIGESDYTDCGIACTSGTVTITQGGEVTCKKCIMFLNGDKTE